MINNVSTNILRDQSIEIDFIPTPNAKEIFDRIFLHNYGANKSFNLIGNYGTGKSTFLWALEKNLKKEKQFFTDLSNSDDIGGFDFIKIVGENDSLSSVLSSKLNIKKSDSKSIICALEDRRKQSESNNKGVILLIDEFGKLLEFASKNKNIDDVYLLQQISEWANNERQKTYFIITLHQNFSSYGKNLSSQDRLEWEKVKGRFVDLVFNEPVEQLLFFASKRLNEFVCPKNLKGRHQTLIGLIEKSNLVSLKKSGNYELSKSIYPLDWLSANVLVNSLQRYGQNERSLFSFLNDGTRYSIKNFNKEFYTVTNVYDYLINSLPTEINSPDNPHRAQWLTTFKVIEKAELYFEDDFKLASEVIKTISLVNLFSKIGGLFDKEFIISYFKLTKSKDVTQVLEKLEKKGIIRFYKHSNKINFLEGTDIDLEQELLLVNSEINNQFSLSNEIVNRIDFPVLLAKKYSFETGTNRFFEFKITDSLDQVKSSVGSIDGYINLIFDKFKISSLIAESKGFNDNLFVVYKNSEEIRSNMLMILKFEKLLEKHQQDKNALKLLTDEKSFYVNKLNNLVINQLFGKNENVWIYNGEEVVINSKKNLYQKLTEICYDVFSNTPIFINELVNKEYISTPINTARKALLRALLENEGLKDIGLDEKKFPPEKAIYINLLRNTGIHKKVQRFDYYKLDEPNEESNLYQLWRESESFINGAISNKRNLNEFYEMLLNKPFKLKKGFVDFWIPVFLIAKKEDFALFHIEGGFIPFIKEDTLDLIHKKPQDFLVKSYDVSGLKMNLLESYKELVQIGDSKKGTKSTFLSIFGNFLRFQRGLNEYTLKTKKLSSNALKLRDAIVESKDPEDALFNQFPAALGYHSISIKDDVEVLASFTVQIQGAIREIRGAYGELLNRIEKIIIESFYCSSMEFPGFKNEILSNLEFVNLGFLSQKQNVFYQRLVSDLDDRMSWIKSVADVALGKSVETMLDEEETILMESIKDLSLGLIKAAEIQKYNETSKNGTLYSIRFFGANGDFIDDKLVVKSNTSKDFKEVKNKVTSSIKSLDENQRRGLLIELLSKELEI
ncbi:MAG: hypothetical protein CMC05_01145 [Flavobacteriaceae bacterium]|nr:hypothetical protein [Flavobacteriaceae bacterium]MBD10502.1 hypothetical protein [Flavobacteriaceae bacterium]|tara:strand:+ start:65824 stop:69033 length:3210 start_codon:yes stop_codon:yes gene_type:complete